MLPPRLVAASPRLRYDHHVDDDHPYKDDHPYHHPYNQHKQLVLQPSPDSPRTAPSQQQSQQQSQHSQYAQHAQQHSHDDDDDDDILHVYLVPHSHDDAYVEWGGVEVVVVVL